MKRPLSAFDWRGRSPRVRVVEFVENQTHRTGQGNHETVAGFLAYHVLKRLFISRNVETDFVVSHPFFDGAAVLDIDFVKHDDHRQTHSIHNTLILRK